MGIAGLAEAFRAIGVRLGWLPPSPEQVSEPLEDRMRHLQEHVAEASRLTVEVSAELVERALLVQDLAKQAADAEALLTLTKEQREVIGREIRTQTEAAHVAQARKGRWRRFAVNASWTMLGIVATMLATYYIKPSYLTEPKPLPAVTVSVSPSGAAPNVTTPSPKHS